MKHVLHHWLVPVIGISIAWRLLLFWVSNASIQWLPQNPGLPYREFILLYNLPQWLLPWINFDGFHYLTIARHGYFGLGLLQAFFPLYPLLIRSIFELTLWNVAVVSLLISHLAAVGMVILWWLFVKELLGEEMSRRWWWILLLFPTSFYLIAGYTESLFMFLVFGSLWLSFRGQWLTASLVAGLASATRVTGVFLLPALIVEWIWQHRLLIQYKKLTWREVWYLPFLLLSVTGLLSYMYYLWRTFGDPLYFFHVQSEFGAGRREKIILLPQVFWRYLKIVWTVRPFDWHYYAYFQELLLSVVSLTLLALSVKRVRPSIVVFSIGAWLLPTLTGTFSSMPRYILAVPAVFLMMIVILDRHSRHRTWMKVLYIALSLGWLLINTMLFIRGYWVA